MSHHYYTLRALATELRMLDDGPSLAVVLAIMAREEQRSKACVHYVPF